MKYLLPVSLVACSLASACILWLPTQALASEHTTAPDHADTQNPNIVVIIADDLAFEDLGCYGGDLPTPHIDRLAREGARFTNHYAVAPVCTPSRYTILTGKFPSESASVAEQYPTSGPPMIRWNTMIEPEETTIGDIATAAGYATAYIGKWHNGHPETWHVPYFAPADFDEIQPTLQKNYRIMQDYVRERSGFQQVDGLYTTNVSWMALPGSLMGHHQHWLTYETIDFINRADDQPCFVYHASTLPHPPNVLESLTDIDPRATTHGLDAAHVNVQPSYESILERTAAAVPADAQTFNAFAEPYSKSEAAGTIWLDDAVGRILEELEATGKIDNTLILLASDHERRGKMVLNAGPAPLIMWYPTRIEGGRVIDALVSNADFAPTLAATMGQPQGAEGSMRGINLWPLLDGTQESVRDDVYMEITFTRGVVAGDWKYIATRFPEEVRAGITEANRGTLNQEGLGYSPGNPDGRSPVRYNSHWRFPGYFADDQLYNLADDPRQQTNLANHPEHADVLVEMKERLREYSQQLPHTFGEFKP